MADTKITGLASATTLHSDDWLICVDTHDTTMASTGTNKKLSPAVLVAGLPVFVASGTGHAQGVVPDPGASVGSTRFLREDASWAVPPAGGGGSGTVTSVTASSPLTGGTITTSGTIGLGTVPVANGGTNLTAAGTTDQILGVAHTGGGLEYKTLTGGPNVTITPTAGTITISAAGGSGGTPGGTNGQIQYNSSSSFGGFTMGGDATIDPTTGIATIANSVVTLAKQANFAASSLQGNPTGSSAAPSAIALGPMAVFNGTSLRTRTPIWLATGPGTALTSSAALTSILAGAASQGSLIIPANALVVGSRLVFDLFGTFTYASGTPTLYVEIALNGTIIGKGTTAAFGTVVTGKSWALDHVGFAGYQVQATGATGKIIGGNRLALNNGPVISLNITGTAYDAPTQVTIDTTATQTITVKMQWSGSGSTYSIQLLGGGIYIDG